MLLSTFSAFLLFVSVWAQEKTMQYDDDVIERPTFDQIQIGEDSWTKTKNFVLSRGCGVMINSSNHRLLGDYQLLVVGTGHQPATLMISAEPQTDEFLQHFIRDWCTTENAEIAAIKARSTLIFLMNGVSRAKTNCDEYNTPLHLETHLARLQKALRVNTAFVIGTGGVKVRYLQRKFGIAEKLARRYQMTHPSMGSAYDDLCASERSPKGQNEMLVRQIQWTERISPEAEVRNMDVVIVLVACCYEEPAIDRAYMESRASIIETIKLRSTGIYYESEMPTLVVNDSGSPYVRVPANSKTFIWLPEGDIRIVIYSEDEERGVITSFNMTLNEDHRFERRKILKQ